MVLWTDISAEDEEELLKDEEAMEETEEAEETEAVEKKVKTVKKKVPQKGKSSRLLITSYNC